MRSDSVKIASLHSSFQAPLDVNIIPSLDGTYVCTKWQDAKRRRPHLKDVPFPKATCDGVDMLIGISSETIPIFVPLKTVSGEKSSPVAVLTPLGWTAFGCMDEKELHGDLCDLQKLKSMTNVARTLRTRLSEKTFDEEIQAMKSMTDLEILQAKTADANLLSNEERVAMKKAENI